MKGIRKLLSFIILIILIVSSVTIYNGYTMYKSAINNISIKEKVDKIRSDEDFVKFDNIPKDFVNAIIAIEDHRFYNHGAIDIISISRAVVTDIKDMSLTEGGSTIYQQLAKNLYFTQEKKFTRKIAEIFVGYDLEKKYSKEDILELYLNVIYFGNGYTGIGQASNGYFDKNPNKLTLNEITLLAGVPNAPSIYALNSNSKLAKERQKTVIETMYKYEYLTEEQVNNLTE